MELIKICPACENYNNAEEVMCKKCGADISGTEAMTKEEIDKQKNETKVYEQGVESERGGDNLLKKYREVYSSELSRNKNKHKELYPRTKEDEEAEKIIAEMKDEFNKVKNNVTSKIKDFYDNITKK